MGVLCQLAGGGRLNILPTCFLPRNSFSTGKVSLVVDLPAVTACMHAPVLQQFLYFASKYIRCLVGYLALCLCPVFRHLYSLPNHKYVQNCLSSWKLLTGWPAGTPSPPPSPHVMTAIHSFPFVAHSTTTIRGSRRRYRTWRTAAATTPCLRPPPRAWGVRPSSSSSSSRDCTVRGATAATTPGAWGNPSA